MTYKTYKFLKLENPDRLAVKTPYNALFVAELKRAVSNAQWNEKHKFWIFDAACKPAAEALAKKYFPAPAGSQKLDKGE